VIASRRSIRSPLMLLSRLPPISWQSPTTCQAEAALAQRPSGNRMSYIGTAKLKTHGCDRNHASSNTFFG